MAKGDKDAVQEIRFARSADGVGIAYAGHGEGPPLVVEACWLSHLQFDWESPVWRHYRVDARPDRDHDALRRARVRAVGPGK